MTGRCLSILLCALVPVLSVTVPSVSAQSIYGSISGTVRDQSQAVVPGAEVVVTNLSTGAVRDTISNEAGFFRVAALPSGTYSVQASLPSFQSLVHQPISVSVSVETTVDFLLKPSQVQEVVTVQAQSVFIETTKSQLSKTVDAKRIMELPGRNVLYGLALLSPGTTPNNNSRPGSGISVNGGRSRSNNFTIDGANNNDQSLSIPRQTIPSEAIQEFQLITNNFSAEYGRNSGSFINVITRSGSNDFHGGVMWTWQGNSLDALKTAEKRTFNAARAAGVEEKTALRRARGVVVDNLGGATFGGPLKENSLFFFSSYDRRWIRQTAVPAPAVAISSDGVNNLKAASSQFAPGALDFLLNTFPLANDPTTRGNINVAGSDGKVIPVPLHQFNRALTGSLPYARDVHRWLQKFDAHLGANDTLSARYLIDDDADPGTPTAIPRQEIGTALRNQSMTLNEVHVFGPRTVNEARLTYARRAVHFPENFPPQVTVTGFNTVGNQNFPQYRVDNMYEWTDNFSHNFERHAVKTGMNVLRYQLNSFFAPNTRGSVSYPSMADLLFDRNASFSQYAGDGYTPARTTEMGAFLQDDYRATQNLTLNLGIRYEYTGTPFGYFSNAKPDLNNWAPRFGFAWRPDLDSGFLRALLGSQTVLRGGYAISYDQVFQNILLNNSRNFPRGVSVSISPITGQRLYDSKNRPAPPTPTDFVNRGGNPNLLPVRLYSPNKRISQPYGQQFSFGFDRQMGSDYVLRVFYVGSRGTKLVREVESNIGFTAAAVNANPSVYASILPQLKPVTNAAGAVTGHRVDPTKGSILIGDGLAQSVYHSLQLTFEKRFTRSLQFQVNYTYSSFINDSDDILGGATNSTLPAVPFNYRLDRGRSGYDQPHRFVGHYIYEFPAWDNRFLNTVLGDWQISGITTFASGTPYTVLNANNALGILPGQIGTVHLSQRASINPSGQYPLPTSSTVTNPYYVANPTNSGVIGSAGRNIERLGNIVDLDMALVRNIKGLGIGEGHSLQVRWEAFNILNHRNFNIIPLNTVSGSTDTFRFLNLGQTNVPGRTMTFMLRYAF